MTDRSSASGGRPAPSDRSSASGGRPAPSVTATGTYGGEQHCLLTTAQRVTGRRHTTELRFVPAEGGVYVLSSSGGLSTWCLNLQAEPQAVIRVGARTWLGRAAFLEPDDPRREDVRRAFLQRYGEVDHDREAGWSEDVVVAHVVFTRELS